MDKRYQVFVSSTFVDLQEERKHIIQTLMEMDCIPSGMELFPAADEEQWDFIKKVIDDCDYYLLLIGGRYGSLSPEGISYTEMEYDYAVSKGMKVIALVHGEPNNLPQIKCEKDSALQEKLEKFIEKVCTGRLVKFWTNIDQISGIVSLSLSKTIKTYPAIGWVRANLIPSEDSSKEILLLRDKIQELELIIKNLKAKPEGIEEFAQGNSPVELILLVRDANQFFNSEDYEVPIIITWDNIFEFLSPSMIVESNEKTLLKLLGECLYKFGLDQLNKFMRKHSISEISRFYASGEDIRKVLVQFRALQLITLSQKKHPPSDTNIYWTLTPYGDQLMTELNAIKKL